MSEIINIQDQDYVFIGEQSVLEGDLNFYGPTKLAGKLKGNIHILDKSSLTVEPGGFIQGTLNCHNVEIFGHVDGDIISTGKITVHSFAKMKGTAKAKSFSFNANAQIDINGHAEDKA